MRLMRKDFQKLDNIYDAAARLTDAGIRPSFNMIFGFPGEGEPERRESIKLIMNICRRFPGAEFWTNIFTPFPGAPIMERAFELGIEVPKTLEGWADFFPRYTTRPWLKGKPHREVQTMRDYLRVAFDRVPIGVSRRSRLQRVVHGMIGTPARWRLDHNFYSFPVELRLKKWADKLVEPPKAKVDAHMLEAEVVTC
jgi:anaerobic magnesium-protoporphyrin IX monomethyl ester cyclase